MRDAELSSSQVPKLSTSVKPVYVFKKATGSLQNWASSPIKML